MSEALPPALLLGVDRLLGLQLARILWRRKVPVIGAAGNPKSHFCRTRSAKRIVPLDGILKDPVPFLKELTREYGMRPVIIPCDDDSVWWLNDQREVIHEYADFLIPPSDPLILLSDKSRFYRYAMEQRLPLPATRFVTTQDELERAAREISFPVILKPPRRSPEWMEINDGFKVLKVGSPDELLRIGPALLPVTSELILQEWVPGPDENMHELFVCFDRQGELLIHLTSEKVRQWPPDIGVGALAVETNADELVAPVLSILQKLGYVGPGHMELKKHEVDGIFYIIEMNTRAALNFPLCEACGVEMTYTCYCAAAGLPLPEAQTVTRPGSKWICWKTDLPSAYIHWKRGDLTLREWLRSLRGHKWSADVQLDDLGPLLSNIRRKTLKGWISTRSRRVLNGVRREG